MSEKLKQAVGVAGATLGGATVIVLSGGTAAAFAPGAAAAGATLAKGLVEQLNTVVNRQNMKRHADAAARVAEAIGEVYPGGAPTEDALFAEGVRQVVLGMIQHPDERLTPCYAELAKQFKFDPRNEIFRGFVRMLEVASHREVVCAARLLKIADDRLEQGSATIKCNPEKPRVNGDEVRFDPALVRIVCELLQRERLAADSQAGQGQQGRFYAVPASVTRVGAAVLGATLEPEDALIYQSDSPFD